ncbi:hypothetical protein KSP40_PGU022496 [Platanthera guangdongensis]|uniref:Uncharacterized protein n=1 Tax=Platanthera guangdongensis TaxID=2320717 RepID=A0ABR2MMY4_9ASPA
MRRQKLCADAKVQIRPSILYIAICNFLSTGIKPPWHDSHSRSSPSKAIGLRPNLTVLMETRSSSDAYDSFSPVSGNSSSPGGDISFSLGGGDLCHLRKPMNQTVGMTLDGSGDFIGEAEKKFAEAYLNQ